MNHKYLVAVATLLCSSVAFAASDNSRSQGRGSMPPKESMPTDQFKAPEDRGFKEITPNAGPRVSHGADVFITADFIYWTARQDGMVYTITGRNTFANINASSGSAKDLGWKGEPGFKVGLGLNLGHDGWDIYAQYTWLHTRVSDSTNVAFDTPVQQRLVATYFSDRNGSLSRTFTKARAKWDHHFNVIDLELGRNYFISQFLTLRPHVGFKGTWQDQDFKIRYTDQDITDPTSIDRIEKVKFNQDMWGLGIRMGLNTGWHFIENFGIFGNLALTALWTDFDTKRKDRVITSNGANNSLFYNFKFDQNPVNTILELAIGLRYDLWFSDDDYHFGLSAAWEEQVWVNHSRFVRFFSGEVQGDLYLHGLTLKARFDF